MDVMEDLVSVSTSGAYLGFAEHARMQCTQRTSDQQCSAECTRNVFVDRS